MNLLINSEQGNQNKTQYSQQRMASTCKYMRIKYHAGIGQILLEVRYVYGNCSLSSNPLDIMNNSCVVFKFRKLEHNLS